MKAILNIKNQLATVTIICCFVSPITFAANTFADAIKNASTTGQFSLAYIASSPDVAGEKTTRAAAFGGKIKFETAKWNNLQLALAPYFSEKIDVLSGDEAKNELNGDFFNSKGDSFAYLAEAYVNVGLNNGSLRFGRQTLETPFINTEEIHLLPNTYTASWLEMNLSDRLILNAGVVTQWAGFDSGKNIENFKKAGVDGVNVLGLSYKMKEHHTFQAWYFDFKEQYSQYYLDAIYQNGKFEAGLQYSGYSEVNNSGIEGNVWGAKASYELNDFTFGLSLNGSSNAPGKSQSNGLGGGSYFTSINESTISGLTDASAQVLSIEYEVTKNFTATILQGQFEDKAKSTDTNETNIILGYNVTDKLSVKFIYTEAENKAAPTDLDSNFSGQFARMNYNF